jgi:hypothetical protein
MMESGKRAIDIEAFVERESCSFESMHLHKARVRTWSQLE